MGSHEKGERGEGRGAEREGPGQARGGNGPLGAAGGGRVVWDEDDRRACVAALALYLLGAVACTSSSERSVWTVSGCWRPGVKKVRHREGENRVGEWARARLLGYFTWWPWTSSVCST